MEVWGYAHYSEWPKVADAVIEARKALLNQWPGFFAEVLNAWCELAKSLKSKGGFTDTQTESRLVQRITPLFSMTASQQLTPSV